MKKELLDYLCGARNAVKDEFILSREKSGGAELLYVSHPEIEDPLYALWSSPKSKQRLKQIRQDLQPDAVEVRVEEAKQKPRPKHTGGKPPYVMLMEDKSGEINDLSSEACELLLKLFCGGHIEWHTGRVIRKRDKKAMTMDMLLGLNIKISKLKKALPELRTKKIMWFDRKEKAYFISRNIAKKGSGGHED